MILTLCLCLSQTATQVSTSAGLSQVCVSFPEHTSQNMHKILPVIALISVCIQVVFPAPLGPRAIMPCLTL